jgi:hypothetical protein
MLNEIILYSFSKIPCEKGHSWEKYLPYVTYVTSWKVIWKWQIFTVFQAVNIFCTIFISTILDIYSLNNLHLIWSLENYGKKSYHKYFSAIHTTLIKKMIQLLSRHTCMKLAYSLIPHAQKLLYSYPKHHNKNNYCNLQYWLQVTQLRACFLQFMSCSLIYLHVHNLRNIQNIQQFKFQLQCHYARTWWKSLGNSGRNRRSSCQIRLQCFKLIM